MKFQDQRAGFSLLEILVAVSIAALALGVLLRSVSLHMLSISRATERYQAMAYAAELIERKLALGVVEEDTSDDEIDGYLYTLDAKVVTADPRVQQVQVVVRGGRGSVASLSAYRLRIKRSRQ